MLKKLLFLTLLSGLILNFGGCEKKEVPLKIDFSEKEEVDNPPGGRKLRFAVSAMVSPKETFIYYRAILDYLSEKIKMPVELVQRQTYAEVNNLIENCDIDIAFVCSGSYVKGKKDFGMELLIAPVIHGDTVYYSYIIVRKDSAIKSFAELRGRNFAFTDPLSNTGCLVPTYELSKMKETPDSFFGKYIYQIPR